MRSVTDDQDVGTLQRRFLPSIFDKLVDQGVSYDNFFAPVSRTLCQPVSLSKLLRYALGIGMLSLPSIPPARSVCPQSQRHLCHSAMGRMGDLQRIQLRKPHTPRFPTDRWLFDLLHGQTDEWTHCR